MLRDDPMLKDDIKDFVVIVGGVVLAALLGVSAITVGVLYTIDRPVCERKAEALNVEEYWGFWEGCIVEYEGERVQMDELRKVR